MQDGHRKKTQAKRNEMDGERGQFDNCFEVLPDERPLGTLLGSSLRRIVCTNKTHTPVLVSHTPLSPAIVIVMPGTTAPIMSVAVPLTCPTGLSTTVS